jgi:hypothetical protein
LAGCLLVAALGARLAAEAIEQIGRSPSFRIRMKGISAHLPQLATEPRPKIFAIGSSMVEFGFHPDVFDPLLTGELRGAVSYNLGIAMLPPDLRRDYLLRLTERYAALGGSAPRLVILESVTADQLQDDRWTWDLGVVVGRESDLITFGGEIRGRPLLRAPIAELGRILDHYVLGGSSSAHMSFRVKTFVNEDLPVLWGHASSGERAHYALMHGTAAGDIAAWSLLRRGDDDYVDPEATRAWMSVLRQDASAQGVKERHSTYLDRALDSYVELVRAVRRLTPDVRLVRMPENHCLLRPTVDSVRTDDAIVDKITTATGVSVIDLRTPGAIGCDDFVDGLHLDVGAGARKFSELLAAQVNAGARAP